MVENKIYPTSNWMYVCKCVLNSNKVILNNKCCKILNLNRCILRKVGDILNQTIKKLLL